MADYDEILPDYSSAGFDQGTASYDDILPDYSGAGFTQEPAPMAPKAAASPSWPGFGQGYVGAYASGAGTVLSFVGQMMAARQAKKAGDYNAQVASRNAQAAADAAEMEAQQHQRNAEIALQDIFLVRQAQGWQEAQQVEQQEMLASQTRAIIGASGLMMRGSPLAVMESTMQRQQKAILAGRYKADLQERALRDQATMEGYAADVARHGAGERLRVGKAMAGMATFEGSQRAGASKVGALGSLLSGSARTYAEVERAKTRNAGVSG